MFNSIPEMLFKSIEKNPSKDIFRFKKDGEIQNIKYSEFGLLVERLTSALIESGIKPDDKIAILADSSYKWAGVDFAILAARGVCVPLYPTLTEDQVEYILKDSDSRAVFVDTEEQYTKVNRIRSRVPVLEKIFLLEQIKSKKTEDIEFDSLVNSGEMHLKKNPGLVKSSINSINAGDICSIVYTSGTTGEPKGVLLNNRGFCLNVVNSESVLNLMENDVFLSFLPLSHLYERSAGHWDPIYRGCTIFYAKSVKTVMEDVMDAKPTVIVSVPRMYEKIAQSVKEASSTSAIKKIIFSWAMKAGEKHLYLKHKKIKSAYADFKYSIAEKLVFDKIKQRLGGSIRCPISGGSPISTDTLKFFEIIGLKIAEGYGMTECHLIISLTDKEQSVYGSCGKPIPGVEIKISEDGEVLVRGETVMKGYYKKPELTSEVIDSDGWFHTGDIGYLNSDNYLFLTDRIKNIIITSGGKNVAPAPIENTIKSSRYIDDICLIGDNRKFISALVIPDYAQLMNWAASVNLQYKNIIDLAKSQEVYALISDEINRLQEGFARVEQIKKFIILFEQLTSESGDLTPTLKIKRKAVEKKFHNEIEKLYSE